MQIFSVISLDEIVQPRLVEMSPVFLQTILYMLICLYTVNLYALRRGRHRKRQADISQTYDPDRHLSPRFFLFSI